MRRTTTPKGASVVMARRFLLMPVALARAQAGLSPSGPAGGSDAGRLRRSLMN